MDENEDGYVITFDKIAGMNLFLIKLSNDDLSKTLDDLTHMIDRLVDVNEHDRNSWLQSVLEIVIEGGVDIDAVHMEVILSNQIRTPNDILETPYWEYPNEEYRLLTLSQALTYNPNVSTSLVYDFSSEALFNPISFKKKKSAEVDLFFMEQPQGEMNIRIEDPDIKSDKDTKVPLMVPVSRAEKYKS